MTDLYIWFITVAAALVILRLLPVNLSVQARMILWLSGSLISSLALLASITYTFWIGIVSALVLGILFTVLLQEKAAGIFGLSSSETTSDEHGHSPLMNDLGYWNDDTNDQDEIIEAEEMGEDTHLLDREVNEKKDSILSEEFESPESIESIVKLEGSFQEKDDISLPDPVIQKEFLLEDQDIETESLIEEISGEDTSSIGGKEESLMEEELVEIRRNQDTLIDEEPDAIEEETEQDLMAERNFQLDFEEEDLEIEPIATDENYKERVCEDENIQEAEDLDDQWSATVETDESTENDANITREMDKEMDRHHVSEWGSADSEGDQVMEAQEDSKIDINEELESKGPEHFLPEAVGEKEEELTTSSPSHYSDPDIEDDEDSLSLGEVKEESRVPDESLRKQLLELMIERIVFMEEQLPADEYEAYIKSHLSENLPDLEYYSISKSLIKHYVKQSRLDKLELFVGELSEKFASYSLIAEELKYVLQQQVQYTKQ